MYGASTPSSSGPSWRCPTCQSTNNGNVSKCTACGRSAPSSTDHHQGMMMNRSQQQSGSTVRNTTSPLPPSATSTPASRSGSQQQQNQNQYYNPTPNSTSRQQQNYNNSSPIPGAVGATGISPVPMMMMNNNNNNNTTTSRTTTPPPGPALSPFPMTTSNLSSRNTPTTQNPLHHGNNNNNTPLGNHAHHQNNNNNNNFSSSSQQQQRRSPSMRTTENRAQQEEEAKASGFTHPMQKKEYEMEIEFLRNAINESKKYGIEIEHTVEYLTDLLRRKTLECESLRTLAAENYEPVRRAIAEQYKSQKRVEKNAQNELKYFQGRIETLYSERTSLVQENVKLKERIAEVERKLLVAQTKQSKPDDDSFFNRILYDNMDKPPYQEFRVHVSNPQTPLMSLLTQIPPKRCKDLQKMRALEIAKTMLEPDIASRLYKFGFFNYLHHLFTILLTDQKTNPDSFATDISTAYKRYVEYAKNPPEHVSHAKNQHFKEKISKLYEAFMPEQKQELDALLSLHRGHEADLWTSTIQNMAEVFEEREKESGAGGGEGTSSSLNDTMTTLGGKNEKLAFLDDDEEGGSPRFSRSAFPEEDAKRVPGDLNYDFRKDKNNDADKENAAIDGEEDNDHTPYYDSPNLASTARGSALLSRTSSLSPAGYRNNNKSASPASNHSDITQEHIDLHTRIVLMCAKYNPNKLYSKDLQKTMEKYPPEVLLSAFVEKYGPEPEGLERKKLLEEIASI